jgi:probable F420-dependent oxidoreductase
VLGVRLTVSSIAIACRAASRLRSGSYLRRWSTRIARETLGPDALLAPEVAVVVEPDAETARKRAREYAATYLAHSNYVRNLERLGYTERDIADGGSDRLIDEVIPHGSAGAVAEAVRAHFDAGADHVCLQPLGQSVEDYRALARELR